MLWNNAGMGEAGPVWEIPVDIVRKNYEVNVFLPLQLTQGVVQRWIREGKNKGKKVVFTSSMGGLFTPANWGTYVSTKHALEAFAEAMQQELAAYGIKIQTINPGAYYTGYNETMADNPFRWLDDSKNFTKRADLRKGFDDFFATPEGKMDPKEMIDRMIEIVPADTGKFRNVVPEGDRGHAEGRTSSRRGTTRSEGGPPTAPDPTAGCPTPFLASARPDRPATQGDGPPKASCRNGAMRSEQAD